MQELNEGLVPFEFKVPWGWLAAVDLERFVPFARLWRKVSKNGGWSEGNLYGGVVTYQGTCDRETLAPFAICVEQAWREWSEMVADNPQPRRWCDDKA